MAIAFDATSNGTAGAGTSLSVNHTCTGSNRILWVNGQVQNPVGAVTCTYNGVSMTSVDSPAIDGHANNVQTWLFYLIAPATGTNSIVLTAATSGDNFYISAASYTGAAQSSVPDAHAFVQNTVATTSTTLTVTTVANNCWLVGAFRNEIGGATDGTGTTSRYNGGDHAIADSNGGVATGSNSLIQNFSSSKNAGIVCSFAPFPVSGFFNFF